MTMGQRIAERRKMLGLSQEALGEKMGVSRQAISKWEADGAIPEIDKLIALSKLFSVSVGWLLGTEQNAEPASESTEPLELTEEQLKMVEEIVKRYQTPKPRTAGLWVVGAVAMCCALVAMVIALVGWNNANRQFPNYDAQLQNLSYDNSYIQSQLSDLRGQLDELAEGEKLLSEYKTRVTMPVDDASVLDVTFTAVPKVWKNGSSGYLSLRQNGLECQRIPCTWDGVAFTAQTRLTKYGSGYESFFVLQREDGTQEQQNVTDDVLKQLPKGTEVQLDVDGAGWELTGNVLTIRSLTLTARLPALLTENAENVRWKSMKMVLLDGGQVLQSFDMESIGENNFELAYPEPEYGGDGTISQPVEIRPELPEGALWLSVYDLQLTLPDSEPGTDLRLIITGEYLNVQAEMDFITLQMQENGYYDVVSP